MHLDMTTTHALTCMDGCCALNKKAATGNLKAAFLINTSTWLSRLVLVIMLAVAMGAVT